VLGILNGIAHLHHSNILHRDLKPSNILIEIDRSDNYVPKITDFGLSKLLGNEDASLISNSFAGGTLDYSSPEQLHGYKLKYNSDLWSFGVIAYDVLTGEKPFSISDFSGSPDLKRKLILQNIISGS